jgi:aryl-alcohol dehydrogenase-like predicted oxidoreductase
MGAFDHLVRAGKVFYISISDTPAWIISPANTIAHFRDRTQFVGLQIEYNYSNRQGC